MSIAMVFPGQGSQSVGMQTDLAEKYAVVLQTYEEASGILGYDLWRLVQDGPAEKLGETTVTQPAMLTAGVAAYRVWLEAGGTEPAQVSGHSLGEYSALVAAKAVSFADAVTVVKERARLMQDAVPGGIGGMAAVLGLDDETIINVCEEASLIGVAEPVNFNSPGQVVIAGHREALDRAVDLAKDAGARRAIMLPVSVPSHSSLMIGAGDALRQTLQAANFETPTINVIAATNAIAYGDGDDIRERLAMQVFGPVQWVRTVNVMIDNGATSIVECGPGKVLAGLCRRISKATPTLFIDSVESLQKSLDA